MRDIKLTVSGLFFFGKLQSEKQANNKRYQDVFRQVDVLDKIA